jgi:uncharacterized protein (TIGR04222 family)
VVIVAAWLWARWQTRAARQWPPGQSEPPTPPLDARELACLRGDVHEVIRLTVFTLVARGHLRILKKTCLGFETGVEIGPAEDPPDCEALDPLEALVHRSFQAPKPPAEIFADKALLDRAAAHCQDVEQRLNEAGFLTAGALKRRGIVVGFLAAGLIVGIGLLRCLYAFSKGNDQVGFLLDMGLVGAGVAVALFGFSVLEGTAYAKLADGFPRPPLLLPVAKVVRWNGSAAVGCGASPSHCTTTLSAAIPAAGWRLARPTLASHESPGIQRQSGLGGGRVECLGPCALEAVSSMEGRATASPGSCQRLWKCGLV